MTEIASRWDNIDLTRVRFPWKSHRTMLEVAETEQLRAMRSEIGKNWQHNYRQKRLEVLESHAVENGSSPSLPRPSEYSGRREPPAP